MLVHRTSLEIELEPDACQIVGRDKLKFPPNGLATGILRLDNIETSHIMLTVLPVGECGHYGDFVTRDNAAMMAKYVLLASAGTLSLP